MCGYRRVGATSHDGAAHDRRHIAALPAERSAPQGPGRARVVGLLAGIPGTRVGEDLQQAQRIRQRVLETAYPVHALVTWQPGGRYEDVGAAAVPAQSRV